MDYLLWIILMFVGMFAKCFGALLAFGIAYYLFTKYFSKEVDRYGWVPNEDGTFKGDK